VERAGIILAYLDEPSAYGVAQRMGLTRQTVKRCLERAAELGWWRRLTTCAQQARPGDHRGSPGLLAARCAHRLVIDRGRWVSAELPDYCDLDGV
jgi:hypothetical protein